MKVFQVGNFAALNYEQKSTININAGKLGTQTGINFNKKSAREEQSFNQTKASSTLPSTNSFLAFCGGYSIDLKKTLENLDRGAYPDGICEAALDEIQNGNPENKTLIDIHKEKYGKIKEMESLEEVKAEFPEFAEVLSDNDVSYLRGSFIDEVKKGAYPSFDPEVDLSLQLLQMYWADGFSLSDISTKYTGGKSVLSTLEKLQIPRVQSVYGNVLKLSDKDYNARLTSEMSERQKEIIRKKAEREDGVNIPRGRLSEETKKKISESLIRHYAEHPEKTIEMSKRVRKYYEDHPEEKENLQNVLKIAWNLRESKSVRKAMSKFFKKKDISPEEFAKMNTDENEKEERRTLGEFWKLRPWAKEQWSKAMIKAWAVHKKSKEKKQPEAKAEVEVYPPEFQADMKRWLKGHGFDLNKIDPAAFKAQFYAGNGGELQEYTKKAFEAYCSEGNTSKIMENIHHLTAIETLNSICERFNLEEDPFALEVSADFMRHLTNDKGDIITLGADDGAMLFAKNLRLCKENGRKDLAKILEDSLSRSYKLLKEGKMNIIRFHMMQALSSAEKVTHTILTSGGIN